MVKDSSLCARTEINPVRFGSGQLSPRVLHRYVAMAKPLVYEKSKKRVLTNVAYSTVVPTKEKAPVNYLNGDVLKTRRVFIRLGACPAARVSIGTRSQILVKHLRVQRPILLKKPSKNSYIKISVDELVEGITKLNIC